MDVITPSLRGGFLDRRSLWRRLVSKDWKIQVGTFMSAIAHAPDCPHGSVGDVALPKESGLNGGASSLENPRPFGASEPSPGPRRVFHPEPVEAVSPEESRVFETSHLRRNSRATAPSNFFPKLGKYGSVPAYRRSRFKYPSLHLERAPYAISMSSSELGNSRS